MQWIQRRILAMGAAGLMGWSAAVAGQQGSGLRVETGTDITYGEVSYEDATVDVSEELWNPRLSIEFSEAGGSVGLGVAYAESKNSFALDFDDGDKELEGDLEVKRKDLIPFLRFGMGRNASLRLGYRRFKYEFSRGILDETEDGRPSKRIRDGLAKGDLTTGFDAEANVTFGQTTKFGVTVGATYFKDAKYRWSYRDELQGGALEEGTAKLDALSLRIAPEILVPMGNGMSGYINYTVSATSWLGSKDEHEDYAGTDIMTSIGVGFRYVF